MLGRLSRDEMPVESKLVDRYILTFVPKDNSDASAMTQMSITASKPQNHFRSQILL